jgi:Arc/MetJ-type ribon-helix-helix transcriptional regulator
MYGMRRTTVYLPDDLTAALERTALAQGKSKAEVIRAAVALATSVETHPRPRLPLFDSGDATLAERVDAELAAGSGE